MTRSGKRPPTCLKVACSRVGERWCPSRFHRARTKGGRPSYPEIEAILFAHSILSEDGHPLCDPVSVTKYYRRALPPYDLTVGSAAVHRDPCTLIEHITLNGPSLTLASTSSANLIEEGLDTW